MEVTAPRVNDRRVDPDTGERATVLLGDPAAVGRKTPKVTEVLPLLYLHGLSPADFVPALGQFLGSSAGLSASVITKLTETWKAEQRAFAERDLSGVDYVYLWADGIHVNIRLEEQQLCLLVMIGVRADGAEGAGRADRRLPGVGRVVGGSAARLRPPRHARPGARHRRRRARVLGCAARGVPDDPGPALLVPLCRPPDYADQVADSVAGQGFSAGEVGIIW